MPNNVHMCTVMTMYMGDGSKADEYADYEVQVIHGRINTDGVGPDGSVDEVIEYEPVSDRGIDSDELAELVAMYRDVTLVINDEDNNDQNQIGQALMEFGLGINLSESEFAEQSGPQHGATEVDTTSDGSVFQNNYSEPGVLDHVNEVSQRAAHENSTSQNKSIGGNGLRFERFMNFSDNFHTGPFVDRTDDITAHFEVGHDNLVSRAAAYFSVVLYWNVEEMPEGRASFSRP